MIEILLWSAVLAVALAALVKASDWFTDAAERVGLAFGMPTFIVGVTIMALGTSLPELVSSVLAVLRDASEIVAGNVVGSNNANLLLILGTAAVLGGGLRIDFGLVSVDLPFLAGSGFFLALALWDGGVGRFEAVLLLLGLVLYLCYALMSDHGDPDGRAAADPECRRTLARSVVKLLASGALIYAGAEYTVQAVVRIAGLVGVGSEIIAASVVALGTSLPELMVTIAAARRGRPELAVGNLLGSNVFNAFAVVGVSGLVGPLVVPATLLSFAVPLMVLATVLAVFMTMEREVSKWEGWLLILLYVYFIGALFELT